MKLYSPQPQLKRYLLFLAGGLGLLGVVYIPAWLGAFDGERAQWNGAALFLFVGIPGFVLALVGIVGTIIEAIILVTLKVRKKI